MLYVPIPAPEAILSPDDEADAGRRADARSNIFVVAALRSDGIAAPVRVRNMSTKGALIDGPLIPAEGAQVQLSRGSLNVTGEIVWRSDHRAGLRFSSAVRVGDWIPGSGGHSAQQRVDGTIHDYRMARSFGEPAAEGPAMADEVFELARALGHVAEELASDHAAAERHLAALQTIDAAARALESLGRRLR